LICDAGTDNLWDKSALAFSISTGSPGIEGMGKDGSVSIVSSWVGTVGMACVSVIVVASADGGIGVSGAFVAGIRLHPASRNIKHPMRKILNNLAFIVYDFYYSQVLKLLE
jgi:hypothetical protein